MQRFNGKVAIITGASRGIGKAIAKKLASEGASVGILDVNLERAQQTAAEISEISDAVAVRCDVSNPEEVQSAFKKIIDSYGKIDILVNNAGIIRDNLLFKMTDDDWNSVIDIHLKGSFLCSREAQKYMVPAKYGKIIHLSSTSALGNRGQVNYASAKAGLQGMTKTMAIELGPFGINVNAVAPGFIETDMTRETAERIGLTLDQMMEGIIEGLAIKRSGKPEDIANVAAFLCSDESSYVTGQVIYVAGKPTV
ncbi:3-oxoacyl-[acyl-carrier protein] reductase [Oikeobacillus pervagus]|uniref:3-oxoacyl-[acyl-carrier protein] reductase n=1 Tax=Oikeobacillus pervagus TaxID=1325931 RepID=A0AAJ1T4A2_9BACI|nr:3-oxoacyl-ACP reductase FabG [Oikeobacillus pervagus]MDQ0216356.1 3-oxoacyl-[acyl-carrier protein] reductase [Oikeobacillus pervagus]